ncbi:high affinity cGMP-specific 3',5'-cyclic phosphodiesterase 9A-like [Asterias rubens]|uniref:high affinity cGMP-specific 3',5'-cyclic phosphodiesterase 9A-like n=1 Tax=Asterias rubens TaxID=7604 RepID=UPI0014555C19|nr:high affinity cGMP-specific 3',5'-cyclic phosphodiesterase 9A-like [Asterias rubens]
MWQNIQGFEAVTLLSHYSVLKIAPLRPRGDIRDLEPMKRKAGAASSYLVQQRQLIVSEANAAALAPFLIDCFRAAAEAGPHDILKLYNIKGNIVNISQKLDENTPDTPYKLEVVASHGTGTLAEQLGFDIQDVENRLEVLEKKIIVDSGETPGVVYELKHKVEHFKEKLESVEHLSWLGLFKEVVAESQSRLPFFRRRLRKSEEEQRRVLEKFNKIKHVQLTDDVREYLRTPVFDNWQWEDAEMMLLMQQMYIDLDFTTKYNIEMPILQNFLFEVFRHYNHVPFHNFKHCFCVSQMMYGMTWLADLCSLMGDIEVLIMITSAICHDLDHPGYNNAYQVNARTELALRYNDISPLENHHCSVAFQILEKPHCNIFKNIGHERFKKVREGMIRCILATDMAKHSEILNKFKSVVPEFDYSNKDHISLLMQICIKVADISNEARPMDVSDPWIDCLLTEFFNQSDVEKLEGLPVAPFMDREKVTKPSSQTGFIRFVLLPLFESIGSLLPKLDEHIIEPVRKALNYYSEMAKAMEEEKRKKTENDKTRQANGEMPKINSTNGSTTPAIKQNGDAAISNATDKKVVRTNLSMSKVGGSSNVRGNPK